MTHAYLRRVVTVSFLVVVTEGCKGDGPAPGCRTCGTVSAVSCVATDGGAAHDAGTPRDDGCLRVLGTYDGVDGVGQPTDTLAISVRWAPTGDLVLMGSEGSVRLLQVDVGSGAITRLAEDDAPRDRIFVAWSPDGRFALTGSLDVRLVAVTASPSGLAELATYSGHRGSVYAVSFSPDGKYALTAGEDGTVRLLGVDEDAGTLTELAVHDEGGDKVYEATWSPDGTSVWTASQDGTARWLDVDVERHTFHERAVVQRDVAVTTIAPSPDGKRVVWGTWLPCPATELWDCESRVLEVRDQLVGEPSGLRAIAWRKDSGSVLTAGHDDTVRLYDVRDDRLGLVGTLRGYAWGVHSVSLSPDGGALLVASSKRDRVTLVSLAECG